MGRLVLLLCAVPLLAGCATKLGAIEDYVAGVRSYKARDLAAAEKSWKSAFEAFHKNRSWSESADVAANLGALYLGQHRYEEALGFLEWAARVRELAREPVPRARILLDMSAVDRMLLKTPSAIGRADEAYAVFSTQGNAKGRAEARAQRGMAQFAAEDLDGARASLEEARTLYEAANDTDGAVLTASRLVFVYDALGEAGKSAGALADDAVTKSVGRDASVRAAALMARGLARRAEAKYGDAEADILAALRLFSSSGEISGEANALQELGTLLQSGGKPEEAQRRYDEAREKFKATRNRGGEARIAALKANAQVYAGDYDRALTSYTEALNLKRQIGERRGEAKVLLNIGVVYDVIGDATKAAENYKHALSAFETLGDKRGEANALTKYGLALRDQRRHGEALSLIDKALDIHRGLRDQRGEGFGLVNKGTILEELGRYSDAVAVYRDALTVKRATSDRPGEARVLLNSGLAFNMLKDYDAARRHLQDARRIADAVRIPELLWQTQFALGALAENTGDAAAADVLYKQAVQTIEAIRGRLGSGMFKADFLQGKVFVYEELIGLHLKRSDFDSALHFVERAKGRAFLDMMGTKRVASKSAGSKALRDKQATVAAEMASLQAFLDTGSAEPGVAKRSAPTSAPKPEDLRRLEALKREYEDLQERIDRDNPEMAQLTSVTPLEAREIRALVDDDTAILEYYVARENVYAFVVTKSATRATKLAINRVTLEAAIERFRKEVVEEPIKSEQLKGFFDTGYRTNLQTLYASLIEPFRDVIRSKKHLVIVPHGALHYLPFQALWDGQGFLIQTHSVSYAPSASVLKFAKEKYRATRETFFGVGNPDGTLPAATVEVEAIAKSFPKHKLLIGPAATPAAVKSDMPKFDILHLATHGELDRFVPLLSRLKMSDGRPLPDPTKPAPARPGDAAPAAPARLTVSEIFDLDLRAALVVLSACETGLLRGHRGDEGGQGDELVGLARAFIYAGSPTVVASLWNVADISTGELMVNFYQRLKGNMIAEALRSAQAQFTKGKVDLAKSLTRGVGGISADPASLLPGDHPYFWAPFVVIGDWR